MDRPGAVMSDLLDIGQVVERTGVPVSTLHVWEKHGLIEPAGRAGLRRQFDPSVLTQIALIVIGQRNGFTLAEMGELLAPKAGVHRRAAFEDKLVELRARRAELDAAIESLEHAIDCPHPDALACPDFLAVIDAVLPVDRGRATLPS